MRDQFDKCRTRVAAIKCIKRCSSAFLHHSKLPREVCYVPKDIEYRCSVAYLRDHQEINYYMSPLESSSEPIVESLKNVIPIGRIPCDSETVLLASGEALLTAYGVWLKIFSIRRGMKQSNPELQYFDPPVWVMQKNVKKNKREETTFLEEIDTCHEALSKDANLWKSVEGASVKSWLGFVESNFSLVVGPKPQVHAEDTTQTEAMLTPPHSWCHECDEQLVQCISRELLGYRQYKQFSSEFVEHLTVSSSCSYNHLVDDDNGINLLNEDPENFWESDGSHGTHWIRLKMRHDTVISRLAIILNMDDGSYLPSHIIIKGGTDSKTTVLNEIRPDINDSSPPRMREHIILSNQTEHFPILEIHIKDCKDEGIDVRIRTLQVQCYTSGDESRLSLDFFSDKLRMSRFPALSGYSKRELHNRALTLMRLASLLDQVLTYVVPRWPSSVGSLSSLDHLLQLLLPLSKCRPNIISTLLYESQTEIPKRDPVKCTINRHHAAEHKSNPSADSTGSKSVFNQIYEELRKAQSKKDFTLSYSWSSSYVMWWECRFASERIVDQGGGFRDTISDIAEELCPPDPDCPDILPYFIRTPNQLDSEKCGDTFIPNSLCKKFDHYFWIGQLMGACFRGKENLVLQLPAFIWKRLAGKPVNWNPDYKSVDEAEVDRLDALARAAAKDYEKLGYDQQWSVTRANGAVVELLPDMEGRNVRYEDRLDYIRRVQQFLLHDCDAQIDAIRNGFMSAVPEAVTSLVTWQELEVSVCGDPVITVEALRLSVSTEYEEECDSEKMDMFWKVMENFTNEDRSRFLRFVTGRKRLPCNMFISSIGSVDHLPQVSTCSKTLYLPSYTSFEIAEEKLRYAAYNCLAIDNDG